MFFNKKETVVWLGGNSNYTRTILKQLYDQVAYPFWKKNSLQSQQSIYRYLCLECLQPKHNKLLGKLSLKIVLNNILDSHTSEKHFYLSAIQLCSNKTMRGWLLG